MLLLFGIKLGETQQIVVAPVATAFRTLFFVVKTNGRLSGHKFYAGKIYNLFENILTYTFSSSGMSYLKTSLSYISDASNIVGGRFVYLDCNPDRRAYYEQQGFAFLQKTTSIFKCIR